ncbi:hypothetical protein [Streptomyces zhihengii]|uniref:Uncharacterized protein n=1 Tax=Streptomyces zhihengii TaxID=1818004 RepID=A0ABS2UI95_9ACTN|nr:hypothetical protein [Streptomyces zhihengii]MBM9617334.1 hypothetical protein [Streptomyces zhihengii]
MSTYVITIPGTFLTPPAPDVRAAVERELRPADPRQTSLGRREELRILTVNENDTFTVRLEVEAADSEEAEDRARETVAKALTVAGVPADAAPLGPAVVTGIDV